MKRKILPLIVLLFVIQFLFKIDDCKGQWVQSDGIYGGYVWSLAVNGSKLFAGTQLGVYTSTNNGSYWQRTSLSQSVMAFGIIGNNIFAGAGTQGSSSGSVYLSTDNGSTWTQTSLINRTVYSFAVSGSNIFAGTYYYGVYLSTNNGTTWTQTALNNITVLSLAISGNTIFAGTQYDGQNRGVYLSTNNGTTWTQTALNDYSIPCLAVIGGNIFAGTNGGSVYKSTNNGTTWVPTGVASGIILSLVASGSNLFAGMHGIPNPSGIYLSTNNGTNWVQTSLNNQDIYALAISGSNIFAGSYGEGIFLSSNNGTSWSQTALNQNEIFSFAFNGSTLFASAGGDGVYRSSNNGISWLQTSLNNKYVFSLTANGNNIFAGTSSSGVYISTNNGTTWSQTSLNTVTVRSLAVSIGNIFAGTDNGVYISTNNGTTWTQTALISNYIYSLAVSGSNIYAGTGNGVYISTNNGTTWTQTALNSSISSLAVNGNNIYAGTGNGVYISTNNGTSWTHTSLNYTSVNSITASGRTVFAGTNNGIYISANNGGTWSQINQGFNIDSSTNALLIANNYILAGTNSYSVWNRNIIDFLPLAPTLYSPFYNSVGNPLNINLIWRVTNYASEYNLVLATDINFSNIILNDTTITDTLKSISNLNPLTYYYWKVKAKSIAGWGPFSSVFTFKTYGIPTQVVLASPENNAVNQPKNLPIKWFKSVDQVVLSRTNRQSVNNYFDDPNAVSNYWLEIATNSSFTNIILRDSSIVDSIKFISGILNDTTSYWWRVKAKNQAGWSLFSSIFKFTTGTTGIQNITTEIPNKFSVSQNYPNPFNPTTNIRFDLPKNSVVELKIYDILGKEIVTIVNEKLNAGSFSVDWNASNYPSGVYFYKIQAGDFISVKKMIMIK
ncbi:MAG TPA: T9SS type A sorting domain-containing protein [Ignavibacteria bacterium]